MRARAQTLQPRAQVFALQGRIETRFERALFGRARAIKTEQRAFIRRRGLHRLRAREQERARQPPITKSHKSLQKNRLDFRGYYVGSGMTRPSLAQTRGKSQEAGVA